jgi:hypothetical protein
MRSPSRWRYHSPPDRTSLCARLHDSVLELLAAAMVLGACATPAPATNPGQLAASGRLAATDASSPQLLAAEVRRELTAMRSTRYQHTTDVDERTGAYFYDCSGLVDYAAKRAVPADADALPISTSLRPLAGDIERYLHLGLAHPIDGWTSLSRVDALHAGDVIAWLATEDSSTGDTGHVMIVLADPSANPARPDEWLVRVADSTLSPHGLDSRPRGDTGLGTGTIGLVADHAGAPIAFYWQGGVSGKAKRTGIALGRPA